MRRQMRMSQGREAWLAGDRGRRGGRRSWRYSLQYLGSSSWVVELGWGVRIRSGREKQGHLGAINTHWNVHYSRQCDKRTTAAKHNSLPWALHKRFFCEWRDVPSVEYRTTIWRRISSSVRQSCKRCWEGELYKRARALMTTTTTAKYQLVKTNKKSWRWGECLQPPLCLWLQALVVVVTASQKLWLFLHLLA